ncbi:helix-turn-helix domain-containing protein [Pedobacter sp.]|uniref:helix-turn-helix domain-containing protein n=1 Tax=Pedobacter sp. TaxID=1411316 RepID=UPI003D7FF0D2
MMSVIPGIEKLSTLLEADQLTKLEKAAERHQTQSNITFSILTLTENTLHIETTQSENRSGKYASEATLVKRTHEVFDKWLPNFDIQISAAPFLPSPTSVVNTAWLERKMLEKGVRIKQIAFETGIDRESIAEWISGKRSMSQLVKAMFYFYLSK